MSLERIGRAPHSRDLLHILPGSWKVFVKECGYEKCGTHFAFLHATQSRFSKKKSVMTLGVAHACLHR